MALEKKGEEWEEYNNAVKWMALTIIFTNIQIRHRHHLLLPPQQIYFYTVITVDTSLKEERVINAPIAVL